MTKKMSARDNLIQKAEDTISEIFSDRSVFQIETAQDLKDLQGFIDIMLDTLE